MLAILSTLSLRALDNQQKIMKETQIQADRQWRCSFIVFLPHIAREECLFLNTKAHAGCCGVIWEIVAYRFLFFFFSSSVSEKLFLLLIMFRPMASLSSSRHTLSSFISVMSTANDLFLFLFLFSLILSSSSRSSYLSFFDVALLLSFSLM